MLLLKKLKNYIFIIICAAMFITMVHTSETSLVDHQVTVLTTIKNSITILKKISENSSTVEFVTGMGCAATVGLCAYYCYQNNTPVLAENNDREPSDHSDTERSLSAYDFTFVPTLFFDYETD